MAQIKIYGEREHLRSIRGALSDVIHATNRQILGLPEDKRFHRFIALDADDFLYPPDRSPAYTIIEISLFKGRDPDTKKALLNALMETISRDVGLSLQDIEITLFETPKANWAIRGKTGDELALPYKVEV